MIPAGSWPPRRALTAAAPRRPGWRRSSSGSQPLHLGLVEGPFDFSWRGDGREVKYGPEGSGYRNPVEHLHFVRVQPGLTKHDPAMLRRSRPSPAHFDSPRVVRKDAPEPSCGAMAEHSSRATGKQRGHPPSLRGQPRAAEHVDTTMDGTKETASRPLLDRNGAEPHPQQLPPGHNAALSPRQRSHLPIAFSSNCAFGLHQNPKAQLDPDSPPVHQQKRPQPAVAASGFDPFK